MHICIMIIYVNMMYIQSCIYIYVYIYIWREGKQINPVTTEDHPEEQTAIVLLRWFRMGAVNSGHPSLDTNVESISTIYLLINVRIDSCSLYTAACQDPWVNGNELSQRQIDWSHATQSDPDAIVTSRCIMSQRIRDSALPDCPNYIL